MQYSQEHLKTMVYAKFGGQTECIIGNWKIENGKQLVTCKTLNKSYSWSADFRFSTPASILEDLRVAKVSSLQ